MASEVVWAEESPGSRTVLHRTGLAAVVTDERIAFPRHRFRSPVIEALSISPSGRIWVLAGSENTGVAATDAGLLTAAPGAPPLECCARRAAAAQSARPARRRRRIAERQGFRRVPRPALGRQTRRHDGYPLWQRARRPKRRRDREGRRRTLHHV